MAVRIPIYEQQTSAQGLLQANPEPRRLIPAENQLPNAVGDAMRGLGHATMTVGNEIASTLAAKEEADANAQLAKNVSDNYQSWTQFEQEAFKSSTNGANGHAGQVIAAFDKWMPEALATVENPQARQKYEQHLYRLRDHLFDTSIVNEAKAAVADRTNKVNQTAQSYAMQAYNGTMPFDLAHSLIDEAINSGGFDPVTRSKLQTEYTKQLSESYLQGQIRRNPVAVKRQLEIMQAGTMSPGAQSAINWTLRHEGGLNSADTNGTPSNFGINQAAHPEVNVKNLTKAQAAQIYKQDYWDAIGGDQIQNPQLALAAFDTAVMAGVGKAKEMLAKSGGDPSKFMDLREKFLNSLLKKDPEKYGKYAEAWDQRNQDIRGAAFHEPGAVNPQVENAIASLPADTLPTLGKVADQEIRGNAAELDRIRADQDRAKKDAQQAQLSAFLPKLTQGQLTSDEVLSNPILDFSQKEHLINGIKAQSQGLDNTTPSVFIDVFNRIHAQPNDPNRITDPDQLNAYIGHGISFTDIQRLRGELAGKNDPDKNLITDFKKMAKSQLSKASMIMADPEGDKLYYQWEINFNKLLEEKRKEGKSIMTLLDPSSKDYLGYTIQPRSIQQAIKSQADAIRQSAPGNIPDPDKRRDGESLEEWAARTNQFGKIGSMFDKATGNQ